MLSKSESLGLDGFVDLTSRITLHNYESLLALPEIDWDTDITKIKFVDGEQMENWLYRIYILEIENTDDSTRLVGDKPLSSFLLIADDRKSALRRAELTWARENPSADVDSFVVWAERVTNG
jgi:hypothetical protein